MLKKKITLTAFESQARIQGKGILSPFCSEGPYIRNTYQNRTSKTEKYTVQVVDFKGVFSSMRQSSTHFQDKIKSF